MRGKSNAYILCSQHCITYTSHCSIRTNTNNDSSCSTSYNNSTLGSKDIRQHAKFRRSNWRMAVMSISLKEKVFFEM